MTRDKLAPFRKAGMAPAAPPEADDTPKAAAAKVYGVETGGQRPQRLTIIRAGGIGHAWPYSALGEVAYGWGPYSILQLAFGPQRLVKITGRDLKPVVDAVIAGTCVFIAEMDAEDGPAITSIEIITPKKDAAPDRPATKE